MSKNIGPDTRIDFVYDLKQIGKYANLLTTDFAAARIVTRFVYSSTQAAMVLALWQKSLEKKTGATGILVGMA
jgi:hypothetical protein